MRTLSTLMRANIQALLTLQTRKTEGGYGTLVTQQRVRMRTLFDTSEGAGPDTADTAEGKDGSSG